LLGAVLVLSGGCYLTHGIEAAPSVDPPPPPITEGACTTSAEEIDPAFGGIAGGDTICNRLYPGSHFFVESRDGHRDIEPATNPSNGLPWLGGYGEIEAGPCANCEDWTATTSGPYDPSIGVEGCPADGYRTAAALIIPDDPGAWRICEGANWPITCCFD